MNIKSILLGTTAGLMVASAAQAADLPGEPIPAAVDYVKVCDAFGAGFFYIPGTETCLDISGRVRFRATVDEENYTFRTDARLSFDARTATEIGTVRSFFRVDTNTGEGTNFVEIDAAFIQFSYLTFGYQTAMYSYDTTLGAINTFDFEYTDAIGITLLVDDLGGGFFVGAGIYDPEGEVMVRRFGDGLGNNDIPEISATVGIADQPWGGISIVGTYVDELDAGANRFYGSVGETWAIRAVADLTVVDGLDIKLTAAYVDSEASPFVNALGATVFDGMTRIPVSAAVSYAASDALTLFAGIRYDFIDADNLDTDDIINAQIGASYDIADGLNVSGELLYTDGAAGGDDDFAGVIQLTRNW